MVTCSTRRLGNKFLTAEAAWILSGDNRLSSIEPYAPKLRQFSDDGMRFFGAYGPRFVDQLSYVTRTLRQDPASRQAIIQVWREQPLASKDVPCTLSWQYLLRGRKLHCVATMRSSDAWTGWVYDVHNFSATAVAVALELREAYPLLELGDLYLTAGSQHLYKLDWAAAQAELEADVLLDTCLPLNLSEFKSSQDFTDHLWAVTRGEKTKHRWLQELAR